MGEDFESQGNFLFRWRGYLPLLLIPLVILALHDSEWFEKSFGNRAEDMYEWFCVGLSFAGLAIRCLTVGFASGGTPGRNTHGQEAQSLNTKGMYSIVRHPLYLGNTLIFLGVLLFLQVWWLILVGIFLVCFHYQRVAFAEEEFLRRKSGESYLQWAKSTPAFIPRPGKWVQPDRHFSAKKAIRKEYKSPCNHPLSHFVDLTPFVAYSA